MPVPTKSALVTGGGRGLGRAIAERLASEGFKVGVLARTIDQVEATVASIRDEQGEALALVADVLDPTALSRAIQRHREWAGGLDTLICAAGQLRGFGGFETVDPDAWWRDLETSLRGTSQTIRLALPLLRESGQGTIAALVGPGHNTELAYATGYAVAQAGLVRLIESLAHERGCESIRFYALNPGIVLTDLIRGIIDTDEGRRWLPQFNEAFAEGKEVGPEVVAEMAAWLAANRPAELNGRVVAAALPPEFLETRLPRIASENLQILRLR